MARSDQSRCMKEAYDTALRRKQVPQNSLGEVFFSPVDKLTLADLPPESFFPDTTSSRFRHRPAEPARSTWRIGPAVNPAA